MAKKLMGITTQYNKFVDNQVLTKDQLNGVIEYFEDQHRLSRVFLSGVGIVCGFKLQFNTSAKTVIISQGIGVTTDGDLILLNKSIDGSSEKSIDLNNISFTHFRRFEDNSASYSFFRTGASADSAIDLWEILPEQIDGEDKLENLPGLESKVAILYLETYAKEGDLCTAIDCDNQGIEQTSRLRVLLVSEEDAQFIASKDSLFSKHDLADKYFGLPDVAVPRVILNANNASDLYNLKKTFFDAINNKWLLDGLKSGINKILVEFDSILQLDLSSGTISSVVSKLNEITGSGSIDIPNNIQYRYDAVKDIVDTYNEIKSQLLELKEECCPDINAFPKHLLLGKLNEQENTEKHYRHSFYKSTALNCGSEKLESCRSLVLRLVEIVQSFETKGDGVKITPSTKNDLLGNRAIPFYYKSGANLLKQWDYNKTKRNVQDTNLSYHTENLANLPHVRDPLNYNINGVDFYRIEGHQGKDFKSALEKINGLKTQYGLAFDLKVLSLNSNETDLNIDDYECEFEDLKVLLDAWNAELECILSKTTAILSGFSVNEPGVNTKEKPTEKNKSNLLTERTTDKVTDRATEKTTEWIADRGSDKSTDRANNNQKKRIVADNLIKEEDSLGHYITDVFSNSKRQSVYDVIAKSKMQVEAQLNKEVWNENEEVKNVSIDNSIEMMAWINELTIIKPDNIRDITFEEIDNYNETLSEVCKRVNQMKSDYQNIDLNKGTKHSLDLQINQMSVVCCSGRKLETLNKEINNRKKRILAQLILSKFIEMHPGLEHKAGVEPGGTFVIVYINQGQSEANKGSYEDNLRRSDLRFSKERRKYNSIPDNTVIADFSLPHLCCSGCSPVNFIIQKPPATLRLEQESWCLQDKKGFIAYKVSPSDGDIAANPEIKGVTIEAGNIVIDPRSFSEDMFGEIIHFTVNQQVTDAQLTVYKTPKTGFEAPESVEVGKEVTFYPYGDTEDVTFYWELGDGTISEERYPTHIYKELPDNDEHTVFVRLTVTSKLGGCEIFAESKVQIIKTEDPPVVNCIDLTKRRALNDLKILLSLELPGSNLVAPIWMSTSELYGGTEEYKNGVLDDIDNYLTGSYNGNLVEMFTDILNQTSSMILEISENHEREEYQNLVGILTLQLQLIYNIIGCQDNEVLMKYREHFDKIFQLIQEFLNNFKEREIKLPESFYKFLKEWFIKVEGKDALAEHIKFLEDYF